jgi:hypothetical protein
VPGAHFIIFPSAGNPSGTHDQLGLIIEHVEAEVARLKGRGVAFESYPPPPGATMHADIIWTLWTRPSGRASLTRQ